MIAIVPGSKGAILCSGRWWEASVTAVGQGYLGWQVLTYAVL